MSGDLFARDADGFFHYRGRADDLLKVGGIWVAPQEIEQCLAAHADVAECAVVGYEEDGLQRPRAFVVAARAARRPMPRRCRPTSRRRCRRTSTRATCASSTELPRTGSGKIDRRALREVPA